MLRVPFLDVQRINARFQHEFDESFSRVSRSGRYLFGAETEAFEQEFATWNGSAHCVAVANGLDALRLTLRAWISLDELAPGDEVIVPANSFIASALAVTESGLRVRFADGDLGSNKDRRRLSRTLSGAARMAEARECLQDGLSDVG